MALTKSDIVASVREQVRFRRREKNPQGFLFPEMDCVLMSRERTRGVVEALLEIVRQALARGEDIRIAGFGKFHTRFRWAKRGRNPRTGETIIIPSRRTVAFKAFRKLRRGINDGRV